MDKPLVSICIPTYNGAAYLAEAMQSAIDQTYPNLEIVISDDASQDNTLKIVHSFQQKTQLPIRVFHHTPSGIGANWNHCMQQAQGEYIKFLFQDDVLKPNCIEEMVQVLEKEQSVGLVACKRAFIIEETHATEETKKWIKVYGNLQKTLKLPVVNGMSVIDKRLFKSEEFFKNPLNKVGEPTAVLFRTCCVTKCGNFREDLKQILDYEFYYRILKKYKIAILDKELVQFRLHPQQATNLNKGNDNKDYKIYDKIMYHQFFRYLNRKTQLELLKKHHPVVKLFFKYNSLSKIYRKVKTKLKQTYE